MSSACTDAAGAYDRLVLGYHAVSKAVPAKLTVTSTALHRQLSALISRGYEGTTFYEAVRGIGVRKQLAVTFDDGGRCAIEHVLPVLAELGMPGTVFVPVSFLGKPSVLTWRDLAALAASGWEIGSHTLSHARLTDLDDATLERELRGSREAIEDALGEPCRSIAYPYGAVDERVHAAAHRAGFSAGCVSDGRLRSDHPLRWPRVGVDGRDERFLFGAKTSLTGRALRASTLGPSLTFVGRTARSFRGSRSSGAPAADVGRLVGDQPVRRARLGAKVGGAHGIGLERCSREAFGEPLLLGHRNLEDGEPVRAENSV